MDGLCDIMAVLLVQCTSGGILSGERTHYGKDSKADSATDQVTGHRLGPIVSKCSLVTEAVFGNLFSWSLLCQQYDTQYQILYSLSSLQHKGA